MTQGFIGNKFGISGEAVLCWEKAKNDIPLGTVYELATILKVPVTELVSGSSGIDLNSEEAAFVALLRGITDAKARTFAKASLSFLVASDSQPTQRRSISSAELNAIAQVETALETVQSKDLAAQHPSLERAIVELLRQFGPRLRRRVRALRPVKDTSESDVCAVEGSAGHDEALELHQTLKPPRKKKMVK